MILAIYNDETLIAFGETMDDVLDELSHTNDFNTAYSINLSITFYSAKPLKFIARDAGVTIEILPD